MNISSALVFAAPQELTAVRALLGTLEGVEVHAEAADGKLVISIEAKDDQGAADIYESIEHSPGVLSMSLVFQQTESNPDASLECN